VRTEARFPGVARSAGHYESFYIKATRPGGGRAIWIRHTVHKRPDEELTGSLWVTLFDTEAPGPRATKVTVGEDGVASPAGAYIEVAGARLGPGAAGGEAKTPELETSWDLTFTEGAPAFRHLPYDFLYRAPLPKTKLLSPYPDSRFSGTVTVGGERLELEGWPGMIGHNWGAEHAERWIWMHANELGEEGAFFDAGLGRIKVGRMTTPWIGNAVLAIDGERHRLGGLDRVRIRADRKGRQGSRPGRRRPAERRRLGLRRPRRPRAQHGQLLDLRPGSGRRAQGSRAPPARVRWRHRVRARNARNRPRDRAPAVRRRLGTGCGFLRLA
jgi:hypothetical protein